MHIKATLAVTLTALSLGSAAVVAASPAPYLHQHNPHKYYGRHNKLSARSNLEDLARRNADAPYGYDRCGWPRKSPYTRRDNKASPKPSASHKPCTTYGPGASQGKTTVASTSTKEELVVVDKPQQVSQSQSLQQSQPQQGDSNDNPSSSSSLFTPISTPKENVVAPSSQQATSSSPQINAPAAPSSSSSTGPTKSLGVGFGVEQPIRDDDKTVNPPVAPSTSSTPTPPKSSDKPVEQAPVTSVKPADPPKQEPQQPSNPPPVQHDARKLGLAWDWRNPSGSMHNWQGASQAYTWSEWPPVGGMPDGASWLPMFTCTDKASGFAQQVASGAIHPGMDILTFNEPDQPGQCPMSAADGAGAFRELITKPYANKGYTIWSPAPTNSPTGRQWLTDFMGMCKDCGIGGIAIHWYGTDADNFISYVQGVYDQFKMPIKVTEFAPMDFTYQTTPLTTAQISAFLSKTQAWLNAQSFITGYYFFGAVTTPALGGVNPNVKLIDDGGAITSLGWQYLGNGK